VSGSARELRVGSGAARPWVQGDFPRAANSRLGRPWTDPRSREIGCLQMQPVTTFSATRRADGAGPRRAVRRGDGSGCPGGRARPPASRCSPADPVASPERHPLDLVSGLLSVARVRKRWTSVQTGIGQAVSGSGIPIGIGQASDEREFCVRRDDAGEHCHDGPGSEREISLNWWHWGPRRSIGAEIMCGTCRAVRMRGDDVAALRTIDGRAMGT